MVETDATGLLATVRPAPQATAVATATVLTLATGGANMNSVRDPISGAVLALHGGAAAPAPPPPRVRQPQVHTRTFFLGSALDVAIQQLRSCPAVSRCTNEKVCTAGTPTGVGPALRGRQARSMAAAVSQGS
jgi:hypothetical protein